jgi:hypothetical protein
LAEETREGVNRLVGQESIETQVQGDKCDRAWETDTLPHQIMSVMDVTTLITRTTLGAPLAIKVAPIAICDDITAFVRTNHHN